MISTRCCSAILLVAPTCALGTCQQRPVMCAGTSMSDCTRCRCAETCEAEALASSNSRSLFPGHIQVPSVHSDKTLDLILYQAVQTVST
ncbi:hypothetical protein BC629DRAFT_622289 [Irpex lacteus]|nr:hypothetical protein BC629DRAFT_622289 [Irpex lacteus]